MKNHANPIKLLISTIVVLSCLASLCLPAFAATFADVPQNHWARNYIDNISEKGYMVGRGTASGVLFEPDGNILGSEVYETLYRLADGKYAADSYKENFIMVDSAKNMWYSDSYEWAMKNGIAEVGYHDFSGIADGGPDDQYYLYSARHGSSYSPIDLRNNQYIPDELQGAFSGDDTMKTATRSDVVMILYFYMTTYLGIKVTETADLSSFSDWNYDDFKSDRVSISFMSNSLFLNVYTEEYIAAWEWAVGSGIIKGCGDGTLAHKRASINEPWNYITRAEYATILIRFMDYLEATT